MFVEESKIEIISLPDSIIAVGLNLQKSGLPISFDSLGKMWELYTEEIKRKTPNRLKNNTEYGICLNKVPDYIVGIEVSQIPDVLQDYISYTIPAGDYVKVYFNAENHDTLVDKKLMKMQKEAKKWAKNNKIKCNADYTVEVYPTDAMKQEYPSMHILIPILLK
jgi:predicted transcriptional regulator YdeE